MPQKPDKIKQKDSSDIFLFEENKIFEENFPKIRKMESKVPRESQERIIMANNKMFYEEINDVFYDFERMKNYKFFFVENNIDNILKRKRKKDNLEKKRRSKSRSPDKKKFKKI